MVSKGNIIGVILAGGEARRMEGRDKALLEVAGKPLLGHVIDRFAPQIGALVLSANGDPARFDSFGLDVISDIVDDGGPLAGILSAMEWARDNAPDAEWVASVAVDTPLLPLDLAARLSGAVGDGQSAVATSGGRLHPTFGLFNLNLTAGLRAYLNAGERKADAWAGVVDAARVDFAADPFDPFFNVNQPADLQDDRLAAALRAE